MSEFFRCDNYECVWNIKQRIGGECRDKNASKKCISYKGPDYEINQVNNGTETIN